MCDITAVNIQILETQMEKRAALLSTSEEETATQTPRSTLKSCDDSASSTMCKSKSGDSMASDDDCEDEDDDDEYDRGQAEGDDEYYAFLREMAGSFQADDDEDSESESGSEEEAEDEEEAQPTVTGRSSAAPSGGLVSTPTPAACGCARTGGRGTKGSEQEKHETEQDAAALEEHGDVGTAKLGGQPCPLRVRAGSMAGSAPPKASGRSANWCPIPERDNRPPVEDDYDVVQATREYSLQRPGDKAQQHREDLCELIEVKRVQAQMLLKPAGSPHSSPDIRAHYARVRAELLAQANALESELATLDQAQTTILTGCAGESFNTGAMGMMVGTGLQELMLGGQC